MSTAKAIFTAIVSLLGIALILVVFGFFAGWFRAGVEVISPENVKAQYQFGYSYDRGMVALAGTWCSAKQAETTETNPDYKAQRASQTLAYGNQYRSVEAQYDAAMANAFQAKHVKPADLPLVAPTLPERVASLGLTCG